MAMLQYDVNSITQRLVTRLKSKASFAELLPFSTNMRILESFSEELSDLANYGEFLTRENTWTLARDRSSLLASEAIHRYNAHRKIGASGNIRVGMSDLIQSLDWSNSSTYAIGDTVYYSDILYTAILASTNKIPLSNPTYWTAINISPSSNVDIPQWTVFSDAAGTYKFTTFAASFLQTSQNYIDVAVIQGTPQTFNYTAQGIANEEITVPFAGIENTYYEVWVNGVQWTEILALLDASSTSTNFETEDAVDFQSLFIKFGDDTYGKKLTVSDSVVFKYISTLGVSGNINSSNIITKLVSTLRYISTGSVADAKCTNIDPLVGGVDEEDIESIRLNAPRIFQAGDRASSYNDYTSIILNTFSFVDKVVVWGAYETNLDAGVDPWTPIPAEENVVHVAAISQALTNLTTDQKYQISLGINNYKSPTDIVTYEDCRFVGLIFNTTAYVSNTTFSEFNYQGYKKIVKN